jgi:hypothetical protein
MMQDPLVVAFESARLPATGFRHREHLRVAWCYLRVLPVEAALERYAHHLRALTVALGVAEKFDAELTRQYFQRLASAMLASPALGFDELLARHDLSHRR